MKQPILFGLCMLFLLSFTSAYELEFYHSDHLGSPVVVTTESADIIWSSDYDVFGEAVNEQGDGDLKYNQKEKDDTGLLYYGARYYNADTGRFITADTVKGEMTDLQSQNLYVYVRNNPMKYIDPTGNQAEDTKTYVIPKDGPILMSQRYLQEDSKFREYVVSSGLYKNSKEWASEGINNVEMMRRINGHMWGDVPYDYSRLSPENYNNPYNNHEDESTLFLSDFFNSDSLPAEGCGPICVEFEIGGIAAFNFLKNSAVGNMYPESFEGNPKLTQLVVWKNAYLFSGSKSEKYTLAAGGHVGTVLDSFIISWGDSFTFQGDVFESPSKTFVPTDKQLNNFMDQIRVLSPATKNFGAPIDSAYTTLKIMR